MDLLPLETPGQALEPAAETRGEPVLIGVYGIGGSGVEALRSRLESALGRDDFVYFSLLHEFEAIEQASGRPTSWRGEDELVSLRNRVMADIRDQCRKTDKIGVIFGHRTMSPDDLKTPDGPTPRSSLWPFDATFSRAFYYSASPASVVQGLLSDLERVKFSRKKLTQKFVRAWDSNEYEAVKSFCAAHRVHLKIFRSEQGGGPSSVLVKKVADTMLVNSQTNQQLVLSRVLGAMNFETAPSNVVVLIEAHNILARDIASTTLWNEVLSRLGESGASSVAAMQRDTFRILRYIADCREKSVEVSKEMTMDPELERLLWKLKQMGVPTVILTCGYQRIWKQVIGRPTLQTPGGIRCPWEKLKEEQHPGLGDHIEVIGGGRASDRIVVTPEDKAAVVRALREKHGRRVYAIGGTELDVPMLKAAGRDAFIRRPCTGELHQSVRALLREHGGQATYIEPRTDALHPDWLGRGNDVYDAMGLDVIEGAESDHVIMEGPRTELEELMGQVEFPPASPNISPELLAWEPLSTCTDEEEEEIR